MSSSVTYDYYGNFKFDKSVLSKCLDQLNNDEYSPGAQPDSALYHDYLSSQVSFYKTSIDCFPILDINIDTAFYSLILQKPGRMLPWHIDEFKEFIAANNYSGVRTYLCFLEDWTPGQIFRTEFDTYTHWKSGDIITWDYLVWHFSSNSSTKYKNTLQIIEGYF